jgi:hypothetical protein
MKERIWEKCPYLSEGRCSHSLVIERAYLIPQLLDTSELLNAKRTCEECGHYLPERRLLK